MKNVKIGENCKIAEDVILGEYIFIGDNVEIGAGTVIKNFVELRDNTIIGENCFIDSRVSTSGNCNIGNDVTLRYDVIIARGCTVGNSSYICPRVMTNNLDSDKNSIGGPKIGESCFIGTNSVLQHGITIGDNVITGSMALVTKDIPSNEIWYGSPAKFIKKNK